MVTLLSWLVKHTSKTLQMPSELHPPPNLVRPTFRSMGEFLSFNQASARGCQPSTSSSIYTMA